MDKQRPTREAAIASLGGVSAVAKARGLKTAYAVSKWVQGGVPAEHILWLAEQTDWKFSPHALAPHLYPHPDDGLPADRRAVAQAAA
ncbi:MAG: YdaS family helix-turn-helix protein [Propionivibrio sp.]